MYINGLIIKKYKSDSTISNSLGYTPPPPLLSLWKRLHAAKAWPRCETQKVSNGHKSPNVILLAPCYLTVFVQCLIAAYILRKKYLNQQIWNQALQDSISMIARQEFRHLLCK